MRRNSVLKYFDVPLSAESGNIEHLPTTILL